MSEDRVTQTKKLIVLADGKEYEIKPLTLKETKEVLPIIDKVLNMKDVDLSEELIDEISQICMKILKRTISDITIEQTLELVDLENVKDLLALATGGVR